MDNALILILYLWFPIALLSLLMALGWMIGFIDLDDLN